jgi:MFS transporter, FSR family, fosmidomycin resistance protein
MSQPFAQTASVSPPPVSSHAPENTVMGILLALSLSHLLNDTIQSLIPAIYPVLKSSYGFTYAQIGLITFAFQMTGSILQPMVGFYTDRRPKPYSLAVGMAITLCGLVVLSRADRLSVILLAAAMVGMGSAIFHPEASRLARLASGGQHGFAQSLFQVGGNFGSSLGPALAALVVVRQGQHSLLWFSFVALLGIVVLSRVGSWYKSHLNDPVAQRTKRIEHRAGFASRRVVGALTVLVILVFSKYIYLVSLSNYYTFYLIDKFHVSVSASQWALFVFLFAVAAGTIIGGPVGDRIGRKRVIWISILGAAPFSLALPHASLPVAIGLTVFVGVILASAFSAILVYAQELVPGNVGLIAGLFFGLAFGTAGIGSALLGVLADRTSIGYVFEICAWLPLLGLLTALLPEVEAPRPKPG